MDEQQTALEDGLDETLEETFPASDAPANTVETGTHVGAPAGTHPVVDNRDQHRFELTLDGQVAFLTYERKAASLALVHTEVPPHLRGRHIADTLTKAAIEAGLAEGLAIIAVCPFVRAYIRKHPTKGVTAAE